MAACVFVKLRIPDDDEGARVGIGVRVRVGIGFGLGLARDDFVDCRYAAK